MKPLAIQVEGLSKQYKIGSSPRNGEISLANLFGWFSRKTVVPAEYIWALKGINFTVQQGEVVGIIGRNGAGKSTLLKILSRVTEPTEGKALIQGRIASLLEVGTGFHPELTGRENIFLNGAILGMTRQEIQKKFDQIVEFSEIGKFIDTPVKRYSSGMYIRLAFSVAAHIEPDILIVDEVLSVGDVGFQKKCLGIMKDSSLRNRTVIFVTHNLSLVRTMCSRSILISEGRLEADGTPELVIPKYLHALEVPKDISNINLSNRRARNTSGKAVFNSIHLKDYRGKENWFHQMGESMTLKLGYRVDEEITGLGFYMAIESVSTSEIVTTVKKTIETGIIPGGTEGFFDIAFPSLKLRPGDYRFYIYLGDALVERVHDVIDQNIDLPYLSVTSPEKDRHLTYGYFTIDADLTTKGQLPVKAHSVA